MLIFHYENYRIPLGSFGYPNARMHYSVCFFVHSAAGLLSEFDSVDKTNPNCVVIGDAAEKFSYQNLNEAFRVLQETEKPVLFSLGQGYEHNYYIRYSK